MAQIVMVIHCPSKAIKKEIMGLLEKKNKETGLSRAFILLEALKK